MCVVPELNFVLCAIVDRGKMAEERKLKENKKIVAVIKRAFKIGYRDEVDGREKSKPLHVTKDLSNRINSNQPPPPPPLPTPLLRTYIYKVSRPKTSGRERPPLHCSLKLPEPFSRTIRQPTQQQRLLYIHSRSSSPVSTARHLASIREREREEANDV